MSYNEICYAYGYFNGMCNTVIIRAFIDSSRLFETKSVLFLSSQPWLFRFCLAVYTMYLTKTSMKSIVFITDYQNLEIRNTSPIRRERYRRNFYTLKYALLSDLHFWQKIDNSNINGKRNFKRRTMKFLTYKHSINA